jgi:5-methylcytosine-specific restriction endonuclease McrBC regulatory subunit McrC
VSPGSLLRNLGHILRIAEQVPVEFDRLSREYGVSDEPSPPLLDLFTRALTNSLRPVETEGVYRRYEHRVEKTSFPRGRFLLTETITHQRPKGRSDLAATSVFDHSIDNGPNRSIKLAIWYLAALLASRPRRKGDQRLLGDLNRAYRLFDGVELDLSLSCLNDPEVRDPTLIPPVRGYYVAAVRLARAVVERRSIDLERPGNDLVLPSLLIDLQAAFEDYLRAILRARMRRVRPVLDVLNGNQLEPVGGGKILFDHGSLVTAEPDIVVRLGNGPDRFLLIGEVKYVDRDFSRDHVSQALAYAVSYAAPVVLMRPCLSGEVAGLAELGRVAGITVHRYLFDLAGDLESEEKLFADSMLRSTRPAVGYRASGTSG